MNIKLLDNWV